MTGSASNVGSIDQDPFCNLLFIVVHLSEQITLKETAQT